jgi:hypothetical protein
LFLLPPNALYRFWYTLFEYIAKLFPGISRFICTSASLLQIIAHKLFASRGKYLVEMVLKLIIYIYLYMLTCICAYIHVYTCMPEYVQAKMHTLPGRFGKNGPELIICDEAHRRKPYLCLSSCLSRDRYSFLLYGMGTKRIIVIPINMNVYTRNFMSATCTYLRVRI